VSNHRLHKDRLRAKGWNEHEIAHAEVLFDGAEAKKHPFVQGLDQWVYWLLLMLMVVGIGVVAVEIVPLMLLADAFTLYPILLLISLGLGTLFSVVIQDIHWLKGRHHVFALLLLPVTAIVATVLVIRFADTYAVQFSSLKTVAHDPLLVGVVFGLGIVLPYAFHLATGHRRRHAS